MDRQAKLELLADASRFDLSCACGTDERDRRHRLTREHRLYQVDFLMRKYGFTADEISTESGGMLSLQADPKQVCTDRHPEFFPVRLGNASRKDLLRVPGLGPETVKRLLTERKRGSVWNLRSVGVRGKRLKRAENYVVAA